MDKNIKYVIKRLVNIANDYVENESVRIDDAEEINSVLKSLGFDVEIKIEE
jgi:ribosomal protein L7/L12